MEIGALFATRVEDKIEPVIKVAETADERKLAAEIGSYVVTPLIERYLDDYLEHYTDTFMMQTTEIGVWISGYFGSGKSHLAKIMALLVENRSLQGNSACERFAARVPHDAPRRAAILRSLARMEQCETQVLAFNLNSLVGGKDQPLPGLLLSQYYLAQGYSNNLIYARVIEAELDKQGKLDALHAAVEARARKPWTEIQRNLAFYRRYLYEAVCEIAPELFPGVQDVERAMKDAEQGEIYNVEFLVETILADLRAREQVRRKPQRILLVLDESGQWIENNSGRLAKLQAFVETAAEKGQGKIWVIVTTHGDMGSIYKEARALEGAMKKIEGRFRFKPALTTENIELVLEDRLFKKTLAGQQELGQVYGERGGVLRGLGELANTSQTLPACTPERFAVYYPFFPYQVHLIPEVVKSLRSKGGHGEQMSGSTRTLLAITQDILRAGRRAYLDAPVGALVSFDEVYHNLVGEGEISPDVRTEISRIPQVVPGATELTHKVAEVLYLVRELAYIPRSKDNLARLLAESVDDDLPTVLARLEPELERLRRAKMVTQIGEEYEFLTGERRTFEEEVATIEAQYRQQDRERGMQQHFIHDSGKKHWRTWLGADTVRFREQDFNFKLVVDEGFVPGTQGHVTLHVITPLQAFVGVALADLENRSLQPDAQQSIFFLCGRVPGFDQALTRYLAMREVIDNWKGDAHKSEEARKLAQERELNDLPKLSDKVVAGIREGLRAGYVVFRGASRTLAINLGQNPGDALRADMASFWPVLYPKYDKVPVRVRNDQKAILDVLSGAGTLPTEVKELHLYDKAGNLDLNSPLLNELRMRLNAEQTAGRRVLGHALTETFEAPPYGWDPNAVRVGIAALVRGGAVKVLINKKAYTNPADRDLSDALRVSKSFEKLELVLEEVEVAPEVLTEVRTFLIHLVKRRNIDETPAALSEAAGNLASSLLAQVTTVRTWAAGAGFPLGADFVEGEEAWSDIQALTNPLHRVREVATDHGRLERGYHVIERYAAFQTKQATPFKEMAELKNRLEAIEHRLPAQGAEGIQRFLDEYREAYRQAAFTEGESWKQLQSLREQALLTLKPLLDSWRQEARYQLDEALSRLPDDLAQQQLDSELYGTLAQPLQVLRESLANEALPAQVAALPERAAQVIRRLGVELQSQVAALKPAPVLPTRPVQRLRPSDVTSVTRVTTPEEWTTLQAKLDERVRTLLDAGYDVDLV